MFQERFSRRLSSGKGPGDPALFKIDLDNLVFHINEQTSRLLLLFKQLENLRNTELFQIALEGHKYYPFDRTFLMNRIWMTR